MKYPNLRRLLLALALSGAWLGSTHCALAAERISEEQASQAALKALPGKVTDVALERKDGRDVYVIEIVAAADGAETDVLVDPTSGDVLGMEK